MNISIERLFLNIVGHLTQLAPGTRTILRLKSKNGTLIKNKLHLKTVKIKMLLK